MITLPASGANLRTSQYWHTKGQFKTVKSIAPVFSDCCYCVCETEIPVFAYLDDLNNKEANDVFSWLIQVPSSGTVTATLTNLDSGNTYLINSNTYGLYYNVGVLKDNIWGFIIKWSSVANLIGFGNYQMNIKVLDFAANVLSDKTYPKFRLMPYSCESAHGTVRIEAWNSGYIEGGFDYRDISIDNPFSSSSTSAKKLQYWIQQIRYYGRLNKVALPVQTSNHWDNFRNLTQVQTQIQSEWNLRIDPVTVDVSGQIIYDNLLADFIYLSDYNANNVDSYRDVKVSLASIDDPAIFMDKSNLFNIKFVDYKQNNLKRHL